MPIDEGQKGMPTAAFSRALAAEKPLDAPKEPSQTQIAKEKPPEMHHPPPKGMTGPGLGMGSSAPPPSQSVQEAYVERANRVQMRDDFSKQASKSKDDMQK